MDKKKLIQEFEESFSELKKRLKFKASLEELDDAFYIKDAIKKDGFLSEKLSRQICYRIVENFMGWNDYLHSLIMPNPQNILNMSESKIFDADERREITELMKKAMQVSSKNSVAGLMRDEKMEGEFIDKALNVWEKEFKVKLIKIMKKINKEWEGK